jgi:hypothetical protein
MHQGMNGGGLPWTTAIDVMPVFPKMIVSSHLYTTGWHPMTQERTPHFVYET